MFLKPYKLKSQTSLGSSQKRHFHQRLEKKYPNVTAEEMQRLISGKSNLSLIKAVASSNVKTDIVCVDQLPMFFEFAGTHCLVPTLYSLWRVPTLLPVYLTTFTDVLPKIANGADLMLADIATRTDMHKYGQFKKGQLAAINSTSNSAAIAVGMFLCSSNELLMSDEQDAAVKILHLFGDELWGHEPTLTQQVPNQRPEPLTSEDFPELELQLSEIEEEELELTSSDEDDTDNTLNVNENNNDADFDKLKRSDSKDLNDIETPNSNDSLPLELILRNAFLAALKYKGKSMQLPLLTSSFFRLYVMPEASCAIDIKKTKYKKLSNFLNEMAGEGFLDVREESKGVDKIFSINFDHEELLNFITDHKSKKTKGDLGEQLLYHPELTDIYIVTEETAGFFTRMNYKRGEGIPALKIEGIIQEYIKKYELYTDPITCTVQLDEVLQQLCDCTDATLDKICGLIIHQMNRNYRMLNNDNDSAIKPPIQMALASRTYGKTITLVSNLECYGIILSQFVQLCKEGSAASTAIVKSPHQFRDQLQIQGNQIRFIYNLLTKTYKVPPYNILGLELIDFDPIAAAKDDDISAQPLFYSELAELYVVTDATAAFFERMNYKQGAGIPISQIKEIIREYVSQKKLRANPLTKLIRLDKTLKKLCNCNEATLSDIFTAITQQMKYDQQMCQIKVVEPSDDKPLIEMSIGKRFTREATIVHNLEYHGIILPLFVKLCNQVAAAEIKVIKYPSQKRDQLKLAGNQVQLIYHLLTETYEVPPNNISGIELIKEGKTQND